MYEQVIFLEHSHSALRFILLRHLKVCLGADSYRCLPLKFPFKFSVICSISDESWLHKTIKHPKPPRTLTPQTQRWEGVL